MNYPIHKINNIGINSNNKIYLLMIKIRIHLLMIKIRFYLLIFKIRSYLMMIKK